MLINKILEDSGAVFCVDCGKCVAVCPMAEMYQDFSVDISPRGIIQKALRRENILEDAGLWCCVGCNAGAQVCPEGVNCRELIQGLRNEAIKQNLNGKIQSCSRCGAMVTTLPVSDYIQKKLTGKTIRYLNLCPACRQQVYMERNTLG